MPPTRNPVSKPRPRPVAPPCPFCEDAVWRFNGRSWYASDRESKKRHVCTAPGAIARVQSTEVVADGQPRMPAVHAELPKRAGVSAKVGLVVALAGLAGLYAARAMRR